jgi:phosphoribosylformylglycinamidine synthase subunit PurS
MFIAKVYIRLKQGLLDPQGKAIESSLKSIGFTGIDDVKVGKLIDIKISAKSKAEAAKKVDEACKKLLANPVMEIASYDIEEK